MLLANIIRTAAVLGATAITGIATLRAADATLNGRIVAVGIPGISAISPVGTFLPGGPIHDKPAFAAYTQPGSILDPVRILVGSNSNFGEPVAAAGQSQGSFLSIDPRGPPTLPMG
jgi:hypothetical protein